jgi:hypothetical protein
MNRMKILHAPLMNAGQPPVLAAALRRLGHDAQTLAFVPHPFGYKADRELGLDKNDPAAVLKVLSMVIEEGFEIFHFHVRTLAASGAHGLPAGWDLPLLRALGKHIVFQFRGTDVRLPSIARSVNPYNFFDLLERPPDENYLRDYLMMVSQHAQHVVVADPELQLYVPWATVVPRAIRTSDYERVGPVRRQGPRVVHAPSRRRTKGTEFVLQSVEALRAGGVQFEFQLLENLTNAEVLEAVKAADIVLDQFHVGWYGVLAMEAMAFGKTVLCYVLPPIAPADLDAWMINANIHNLTVKLREAIENYDLRCRLAEGGRRHCEQVHEADTVGAQLAALYEDRRGSHWRFGPANWPTHLSKSWVATSLHQISECRAMLERNELLLQHALELAGAPPPASNAAKKSGTPAAKASPKGKTGPIRRFRGLLKRLLKGDD